MSFGNAVKRAVGIAATMGVAVTLSMASAGAHAGTDHTAGGNFLSSTGVATPVASVAADCTFRTVTGGIERMNKIAGPGGSVTCLAANGMKVETFSANEVRQANANVAIFGKAQPSAPVMASAIKPPGMGGDSFVSSNRQNARDMSAKASAYRTM